MINRRNFIRGSMAFIASPAIVRAASLMPVRTFIDDFYVMTPVEWSDLVTVTRQALIDNIYHITPTLSRLIERASVN